MSDAQANNFRSGDVLEDIGPQPHNFDVADVKAAFNSAERRKAMLIGGAAGLALGLIGAYVIARVTK